MIKNICFDLLIYGNPLIDIYLKLEEEELKKLKIQLEKINILSFDLIDRIINNNKNKIIAILPGGGALNTGLRLHKENIPFLFNGVIGNDYYGDVLLNKLNEIGIKHNLKRSIYRTGICIYIYCENYKKTILVNPGAAIKYDEFFLDETVNSKYFYTDGYFAKNINTFERLLKNFSTFNIFDFGTIHYEYENKILEVINNYIDILIINREEYEYLKKIIKYPLIINNRINDKYDRIKYLIYKLDKDGLILFTKNEYIEFQNMDIDRMVDDTGCGDNLSAGILKSFLNNKTVEEGIREGLNFSREIISTYGGNHFEFSLTELQI